MSFSISRSTPTLPLSNLLSNTETAREMNTSFYPKETLHYNEYIENLDSVYLSYILNSHVRVATCIPEGTDLRALEADDWTFDYNDEEKTTSSSSYTSYSLYEASSSPCAQSLTRALQSTSACTLTLITKCFPDQNEKPFLLNPDSIRQLKNVLFVSPGKNERMFFSAEQRAFVHDLYSYNKAIYWLHPDLGLLQYVEREHSPCGMFIPCQKSQDYKDASLFALYGSHLISSTFQNEFSKLLDELMLLKKNSHHRLLHSRKPLALITGGGPGIMQEGNMLAKQKGILSLARQVDFSHFVKEKHHNDFAEGIMTYESHEVAIRQCDFIVDFPIFAPGGIGTKFELRLEIAQRKTHNESAITPIILFGDPSYWAKNLTSSHESDLEYKTIQGAEWIGNCIYVVQTASQALSVYRKFCEGKLEIGKNAKPAPQGFIVVEDESNS